MNRATPTPELKSFCEEWGIEEVDLEFDDDGYVSFNLMPEPEARQWGLFPDDRFVELATNAFITLTDKDSLFFSL